MSLALRAYRGADQARLLALWNATLTHDRIDEAAFCTRVLLDPNFRADRLLLADEDGELLGFVLGIARQVPLFLDGLQPDRGWITAFGVSPARRREGIGRRLLEASLARFAAEGRRRVLISPYTPNYFTPGVDPDAYPEAAAFLAATGWQTTAQPISMRADLTGFQVPPKIVAAEASLAEEGVIVRPVRPADLPALLPMISAEFGWDWYRCAQESLVQLFGPGADDICFLVAVEGERITGYCQQRRERFGPFGVLPEFRGRGIGRVLLCHCLSAMLAKGFHCAWFLWTGADAARVYRVAGFKPVRRFLVMAHDLG